MGGAESEMPFHCEPLHKIVVVYPEKINKFSVTDVAVAVYPVGRYGSMRFVGNAIDQQILLFVIIIALFPETRRQQVITL